MGGYKNFQVARNRVTKSYISGTQGNNKNKTTDNLTKSQKLMQGVGKWTAFWRKRPDIFMEDIYGIKLKTFQKFLLCLMMRDVYFMFLASRRVRQDVVNGSLLHCPLYIISGDKDYCCGGTKVAVNEDSNRENTGNY